MMKYWKTFNNRGFSIIQGLVVTGVLATGALGLMKLKENQIKATKFIEERAALDSGTNIFQNVLINTDACTNTIGQVTDFNQVEAEIPSLLSPNGNVVIEIDQKIGSQIILKKIYLKGRDTDAKIEDLRTTVNRLTLADGESGDAEFFLVLDFHKTAQVIKTPTGHRSVREEIPVVLTLTKNSGSISMSSCYAGTLNTAEVNDQLRGVCELFGGTFEDTDGDGKMDCVNLQPKNSIIEEEEI